MSLQIDSNCEFKSRKGIVTGLLFMTNILRSWLSRFHERETLLDTVGTSLRNSGLLKQARAGVWRNDNPANPPCRISDDKGEIENRPEHNCTRTNKAYRPIVTPHNMVAFARTVALHESTWFAARHWTS
jgi:hypothetical protein